MSDVADLLAGWQRMTDVERVRVGRFEWERLMLSGDLPWVTRAVLLALGVYMSEDGGNARPGLRNLATVTGLAERSLTRHLTGAVEKGYLDQVVRGGYRGGRSGDAGRIRASVYAATVPADVFEAAADILMSPPWRKSAPSEPANGGGLTPNEGVTSGGFTQPSAPNEPANGGNEPANRGNEPATSGHPSRSEHHAGNITQAAAAIIQEATGATPDEASAVAELIQSEKAPRSLTGLLRHLASQGELAEWLARIRTDHGREAVTAAAAVARQTEACPHGIAGGAAPHPETGLPWFCALCRVHAVAKRNGVRPATTDLRVAAAANLSHQLDGRRPYRGPFRNPTDPNAYEGDL